MMNPFSSRAFKTRLRCRGEMAAALARKVPHYGKYTHLLFEGAEATNVLKGQWPVTASPLAADLP